MIETKQSNRVGCTTTLFNTVIDQGIAGDIAILADELSVLNDRRTDLNRWLAAYIGKRSTACVDSTGTSSTVYQSEITRYSAYTFQGEPVYSTWG